MLRTKIAATLCALALGVPAAHAVTGDVDDFGYTVRSSTDGGSEYAYSSVTSGTYLNLADEDMRLVQLPFPFTFYGESYGAIDIHSNGALSFGANGYMPWNHECDGLVTLTPRIWVWYDDIDPETIAAEIPLPGIYRATIGTAPTRIFIVEWYRLPLFQVSDTLSFQVKLFEEDGRIEMLFSDTQTADGSRNGGATAMVGISNTGATPLEFSCDSATLSTGFAVTFYPPCEDVDNDGYCPGPAPEPSERDCDDSNPDVHPGADEACDGLDNDCSGAFDLTERDDDGDGQRGCEGDCDDTEAARFTGGEEVCDGLDNDCDDVLPDDEADEDIDGELSCQGDCDDTNDAVHTNAVEECNGVDDDCDGTLDDPDCPGGLPGTQIPHGCLVRCSATQADPRSGALVLAMLGAATSRRRRAGRADSSP